MLHCCIKILGIKKDNKTENANVKAKSNLIYSLKIMNGNNNTIEEKIAEMQKRKKGLVKKVVSCDDEAIAKLTWEDVLELLQT